jgi:LuxR family transcriptional regulator, maltose regulon positive regulatory protein
MVIEGIRQPILLTKLAPPSLGRGLMKRDRLLAVLQEALIYPVVLVTAPTGYGKTTCLADYASNAPGETSWLSLEELDNDPVRFWAYFTAALSSSIPNLRLDGPVLIPGLGHNSITGGLDELCNALVVSAHPISLVLDDFQRITHPNILRGITYLVDHIPVNFHLIISSRTPPALPLTRLRAKNRLAKIVPAELNFSEAEVSSFFGGSRDAGVSQVQIQQVMALTRGWPAGIRLMEVALRDNPNCLDAWQEGSKLAVDYLTSEIIEQLPPEWSKFLVKIAIFEQFTLETALSLADTEDAAALLERILQADLFLYPLRGEYQFLPFFREALLQKLSSAESRSLHRKAAAWFETHGLPERAIAHSLAGQDWDCAIRLIFSQVETKLQMGEIQTLQNWLLPIPEDVRGANPDLRVLQGWSEYWLGNVPAALQTVHALEEGMAERIQNRGFWAGLRSQLALVQEQNRLAFEFAQQGLAETNEANTFIRGILLSLLATSQQALGDSDGAVANFKLSIKLNRTSGNNPMAFMGLISLGIELNEMGKRDQAFALCNEVIEDTSEPSGEMRILSGLVDLLLARLYWEANQLEEAQIRIDQSSEKLDRLGIPGLQISGELIRVLILMAREDFGDALNLINRNRRRARSGEFVGFRQIFDLLRADVHFRMGNLSGVNEWLEGAELPASPFDNPARELEFVLKAQYLMETGSIDEAGQLLNVLEDYAQKIQHIRILIAVLLNQATLAWKKGNPGLVKKILEEALALAAPRQYIRVLLDYAGPLLGLLAQLPGAPAEIRTRFRALEPSDQPGLIEMLTAREMDVLQLLAENKTNPEIARQLVLSGETIKVHLKHIFQKLEVADRRQAVRRARELELI